MERGRGTTRCVMDDTTELKFDVKAEEAGRRKLTVRVPIGGSKGGRAVAAERRRSKRYSAATKSAGSNAVERYWISVTRTSQTVSLELRGAGLAMG